MLGLLYKEYLTGFRIKKVNLAVIIVLAAVVFIAARMLTSGTAMGGAADTMFMMLLLLYVCCTCFFAAALAIKIGEDDGKNRLKNYLLALPISKKEYVLSKYLFVGIVIVGMTLLQFACGKAYYSKCSAELMKEYAKLVNSFLIPFGGICLLIAAIELPLIIRFGKEKAVLVGMVILIAIVMGCMWFLFFGDLNKVAKISIEKVLVWAAEHKDTISLVKKLVPLGGVALYGISFWITASREEARND